MAEAILSSLHDLGLGYLSLGQPSPDLSGGEAQRVKLAKWLARARPGDLVTLDEPTIGLHPADLERLTSVLRRLTDMGSTVVVVEHHPDVAAAADWLVRLGPGAGPDGGRLMYAGPPRAHDSRAVPRLRPRAKARSKRRSQPDIRIRRATANNLKGVSLSIPKDAITAIVGVSGSGKSSLLRDVLGAEASRRLLECLSMYERQSIKDGPEASADSIDGLGPTVAVGPDRRHREPRTTVGSAMDVSSGLSILLAFAGERRCPSCGGPQRRVSAAPAAPWACRSCGVEGGSVAPVDFSPGVYASACLTCQGLRTIAKPRPERLIVRPDVPLCGGAMYSPGYYPQGYLCSPPSLGVHMLRALGDRYGFDPDETPWVRMSEEARHTFLYAEEPVEIPASGAAKGRPTVTWRGFFPIVSGWDLGGMYVDRVPCPACGGARLRPEALKVRLEGLDRHELHQAPISELALLLDRVGLPTSAPSWVATTRLVAARRAAFLVRVGLGYVHLDRLYRTLSAGETQRVKLASLLGADLTGMTVLLDEPTRGLHPLETSALADVLCEFRDTGNTVIVVDHDRQLQGRADHLVLLGPDAGRGGGRIVAAGPAGSVRDAGGKAVRRLLEPALPARVGGPRRRPSGWMVVRRPTANNLRGDDVRIPLGVLVGMCGVSGSGKSTLAIDVLARTLAPVRVITSVAYDDIVPGAHEEIDGAPPRIVVADQLRSGIRSPGAFLGVMAPLRRAYAGSAEAAARGVGEADLSPHCDACKGQGSTREDMGFLPSLERGCDACDGTGYRAEARQVTVRGYSLAGLEAMALEEVLGTWRDFDAVARPLRVADALGLGYLVLGQRGRSLSGGEAQRLKLARELARPTYKETLYILDEPTVGLHGRDVARLADVLDGLIAEGHTVLIVEHEASLLACCDALIELGPGGGPDGGRVVAEGTPEELAAGSTPIATYLAAVLVSSDATAALLLADPSPPFARASWRNCLTSLPTIRRRPTSRYVGIARLTYSSYWRSTRTISRGSLGPSAGWRTWLSTDRIPRSQGSPSVSWPASATMARSRCPPSLQASAPAGTP